MPSPSTLQTEEELEERLSCPTPEVVQKLSALDGDVLVLGVGGKMGPTLARMAARALKEAGSARQVIGVSRFSQTGLQDRLEAWGVKTVSCDLLDREAVQDLPDAPNVIYMAGMKFGSTGAEATTWAMNAVVPALIAERYKDSRIVVFSSGNVYPMVPIAGGGATEETPPGPVGEYAQSVLARERIFEYFSRQHGTPEVLLRLNYAVELRYGVLLDLAQKVWNAVPVDLTMGCVNVIWQGDANAAALHALEVTDSPPHILNLTGPETLSVRELAHQLGALMHRTPIFTGEEAETALLNDSRRLHHLFGPTTVPVEQVLDWTAYWVMAGGPTLDKPTHFETRDGKF